MAYSASNVSNGLEDYHLRFPQSSSTLSEDYLTSVGSMSNTHKNKNSISSASGSTVSFPNFTSPQRSMASRSSMSQQAHPYQQHNNYQQPQYYSAQQQLTAQRPSTAGERINVARRFTTNTTPSIPVISQLTTETQQRRLPSDSTSDLSSATFHKFQLLEKKKLEYEILREQRRRFEAEMELIDLQARREEDEMNRLASDLGRFSNAGHQSEPTTPPEHREAGVTHSLARPSRFSSASMTSPPGVAVASNRPSRSGSQITSPSTEISRTVSSQSTTHMPSKSVPGSRRDSDEEDGDDFANAYVTMKPRSNMLNRNSMPVTSLDMRGRSDMPDLATVLGHVNTTDFLFGDETDKPARRNRYSQPYLRMDTTEDKFPILVRREEDGSVQVSSDSTALDLALSQTPETESQSNDWPSFNKNRHSQQSLPLNALRRLSQTEDFSQDPSITQSNGISSDNSVKLGASNRRSVEVKFNPFADRRSSIVGGPVNGTGNGVPKLQSSYSTSDIPTVKNPNGAATMNAGITKSRAEQRLHNHNASLGRIPPGAVSNRQSREISSNEARLEEQANTLRVLNSALQPGAPAFGPSVTAATTSADTFTSNALTTTSPATGLSSFANPNYYDPYGVQMMNMDMANMQLNGAPWNNQMAALYQGQYPQYPQSYQQYGPGRTHEAQTRAVNQRRVQTDGQPRPFTLDVHDSAANLSAETTRWENSRLEELRNEIYAMCKDQHGCRFLQRALEERNPEHIQLIYEETNQHAVELMTDPFGNYLCQKLLEYANDEQRTSLINNAAPQMVKIAFNQHGTRALQKMIDFVSTPEQVETIIQAFDNQVVQLIQDLNGNHVIQKCLNRLSAEDAQFIFNAVGANCVVVGTHRHGCCVLQRCIDHASGQQKAHLVNQITASAFQLVQDPYGNYVVQYILDLGIPEFSQPICHVLCGNISVLSKQKFSSNVIEKCLRVAEPETLRRMMDELVDPNQLESLLRDSFGNYVIQTAIDTASPEGKVELANAIRPFVPSIRQTPHGRRIATKVNDITGRISGNSSGHVTPHEGNNIGHVTLPNQWSSRGLYVT